MAKDSITGAHAISGAFVHSISGQVAAQRSAEVGASGLFHWVSGDGGENSACCGRLWLIAGPRDLPEEGWHADGTGRYSGCWADDHRDTKLGAANNNYVYRRKAAG